MENFKWKVKKTIEDFRNLKDIDFEFIRGGITIIVGENNIGKTNLLDYIYEKNGEWDGFIADDEHYEKEESEMGLIPSYRSSYPLLELFFPEQAYSDHYHRLPYRLRSRLSPYLMHASHPRFARRPREAKVNLAYRIYYFDLTASTAFLTEEGKKELRINKIKSRSWEICYGKFEEKNTKRDYFIIESKEPKEEIESWTPRFDGKANFVRSEENGKITYWGLNKNTIHPLDKLGSGYLKYETIDSLLENLKDEKQFREGDKYKTNEGEEWKRAAYPKFVYTPILLMDEPEVFLHPSFISRLAEDIKKIEDKNVTTILTTHSPKFLSHFVSELFTNDKVSLVIVQKDKDGNLKTNSSLDKIVEEIRKNIEEIWKNYCPCFKNEVEEEKNLYYNKWKTILNEHTLKVFFIKKVLFVEGMTEYILFASEFVKREIPGLESIEIIPIFGKFNYVFLSKLTEKLGIKCRFLLDKDNNLLEEAKRIERGEMKGTKLKGCNHESKKCTKQQVHKIFWDTHTKGRFEEQKEDIIYDERGEIDWFRDDIEHFLGVEFKDKFVISKELAMLSNMETLKKLEKDNPEEVKRWKERVAKLKRVVEKLM